MSEFDGDYKDENYEPTPEDLASVEDLADEISGDNDLFDPDEYEVYPNGVDAFNDNPRPVYNDEE